MPIFNLSRKITFTAAVAGLALVSAPAAIAGSNNDGMFDITATASQLTTTVAGAETFADSATFAGYTGSVVTPLAQIAGGALNPAGSINPDTGICAGCIINFVAAAMGDSETITFDANQSYFGLLWGSVDATNTISFYEGSTLLASYTGAELEANAVALGAYPGPGSFVDFLADSGSFDFNRIVLSSGTGMFFETSNFAALAAAVPEPAAWALLLAGFAGLGTALRMQRGKLAAG